LVIAVFLALSLATGLGAATNDLARLRGQVAAAEEAEDKAAIVELSRRIVALRPNDVDAWERLARTQFELKEFDRCAQTLDAWEKAMRPAPAAIEDFRGDLAAQAKNYAEAERHWLAFLGRKPSPADAASMYEKLAELCANQSRWIDHEKYRAKALAAEASIARRVAHATALLRLHQWDAAYAEMAKANQLESTDAEVKQWLPQFERLKFFLPEIRAIDARLAKSPDDVDLLLERARLFARADRPLLVVDDCERAMKLAPRSMRARIQLADALLKLKRADDAAKLQVSAQLVRGRDGYLSYEILTALRDADARLIQNPNDADALAARAKTLFDLKQFALALNDAQAALKIDNRNVAAHIEAAKVLDELDQTKDALAEITKATELNPKDSAAWFHRGTLEARRADFAAAIDSFTRSLEHGEWIEALRAREKAERRIGQADKADADLNRIRQLDPTSEE
jgi:tetratricopeptide (TPR) repeat protein